MKTWKEFKYDERRAICTAIWNNLIDRTGPVAKIEVILKEKGYDIDFRELVISYVLQIIDALKLE